MMVYFASNDFDFLLEGMMPQSTRSTTIAIAGGIVSGLIVAGAFTAITPWRASDEAYPIWAQFIAQLGNAFQAIVAGFATGYLLRRPSFVAGAIAGGVCVLLVAAGAFVLIGAETLRDAGLPYYANIISMAVAASLTNGVSGVAGDAFSRARGAARVHEP
jgi:hypothetical protein